MSDNSLFSSKGKSLQSSWLVPPQFHSKLRRFVEDLESSALYNWSMESPTIYNTLCNMYGAQSVEAPNGSEELPPQSMNYLSAHVTDAAPKSKFPMEWKFNVFYHLASLIWLRYEEFWSQYFQFIVVYNFVPFLVAYLIAYSCTNVDYQNAVISSDMYQGLGSVLFSSAGKGPQYNSLDAFYTNNITENEIQNIRSNIDIPPLSAFNISSSLHSDGDRHGLAAHLFSQGSLNSNDLWNVLSDEYFGHKENRIGAFVMNDVIPNWMQTTLYIETNNPHILFQGAVDAINQGKPAKCLSVQKIEDKECNSALLQARVSKQSIDGGENALVVSSTSPIVTGITFMTNITAMHSPPIFLKEVMPHVFSRNIGSHNLNLSTSPDYELRNYPLPTTNRLSSLYLQRGYLGSCMILVLMLIISISTVRVIADFKNSGIKSQLHLAGVTPGSYWTAMFICDSISLLVTLLMVSLGIYLGDLRYEYTYFVNFKPL